MTTFVRTFLFFTNNHAFSSKNRLTCESFMSRSLTSKSLLVTGKSLSVVIFVPLLNESSLTPDILRWTSLLKKSKTNWYILIKVTEMAINKMNFLQNEYAKIKKGHFIWEPRATGSYSFLKIHSKQSYNFADTFSRTAWTFKSNLSRADKKIAKYVRHKRFFCERCSDSLEMYKNKENCVWQFSHRAFGYSQKTLTTAAVQFRGSWFRKF